MNRIVFHIDMDAFFAAVEERDNPRFKGKPIVVGADPEDGKGRGVVSTANYVARKYGIRSALPISKAWQFSEEAKKRGEPGAIFLSPDFRKYSVVSKNIMAYLETISEKIEQASVDEAYIEKSKFKNQNEKWEESERFARKIKEHIFNTEKLTCSIGIGPNKLIAKIASDMQKPDGLTVVKEKDVQMFLDLLSVRKIPGIGPKGESTLHSMGIQTIRDLRGISEEELEKRFGKWGIGMYLRAQGIDDSPVEESHERKSIGEEITFDVDTLDPNILLEALKELSKGVSKDIERKKAKFKTVAIKVRFSDFETLTRAHTLEKLVSNGKTIESEALRLFLPFLDSRENPKRKKIRLIGVRIEKLSTR